MTNFDWIQHGVKATHTHELPEHSLGDVQCAAPKQAPDGTWVVRVMPDDHSIWEVECSQLTEGWSGKQMGKETLPKGNFTWSAKQLKQG